MSPLRIETFSLEDRNIFGKPKSLHKETLSVGFRDFDGYFHARVIEGENKVSLPKGIVPDTSRAAVDIVDQGSWNVYYIKSGRFTWDYREKRVSVLAVNRDNVPIRRKRGSSFLRSLIRK